MTTLYCLQADVPLTKTYTKRAGDVVKTPYPMTWQFTSVKETFSSLVELERLVSKHAAMGNCLLKGKLARDLVRESRAGGTNTNESSDWIVLDLDGLPENIETVTATGQTHTIPLTIDLFLAEIGLSEVSYVLQWSASYGISDNRIRAHVFMMLDKEYSAPLLKQWLIQKNHETPLLRAAMELTKTGNTIRWPLDISACQNDKLIYVAPPVLKGIKDPLGKTPRIQHVKRKYDVLSLSTAVNSTEKNKQLTHARINELRDAAGMTKRKFTYKVVGGVEVMLKPDEAVITDMKVERDFVYFNLNGGDSWAYYHPENRPDYVYNFKGEPSYLTKELLPEYWAQLTQQTTTANSAGITRLAFCDKASGVYWRGSYDNTSDTLDIYPAKNETILRDFCKQHGVALGDFIPEWDLTFDPHDNVRVDVANRTVNRFKPSQYMKTTVKKTMKCPPTVFKVVHHALGGDVEITEHFLNWVAFVLQYRDRAKTAWVTWGAQGTGKGILTNNILRPIFGAHCTTRRMEELAEKYNHYMADSLMVFVDEVQIKALGNEKGIMAKLKNFITEEVVPIRAMHSGAFEARNYTNWILMSNMADPVLVDKGDRRLNVGRYQSNRLVISDAELEQIEKELQGFHDYLMTYAVDVNKARTVIQSEDRDNMMAVSESSIDSVANALLDGNFEYLLDMLPTDETYQSNALIANKVNAYRDVLKNLMVRTRPDGKCNIARDELHKMFDYLGDNLPKSPNKFTIMLKHHRVHISKVWINNKAINGIQVQWQDVGEFSKYATEHFKSNAKAK